MINLRNATIKYDHRAIAGLHGIDLEIPNKEVFAILGPNGCGKSTLLKVISGEVKLESGSTSHQGKLHHFIFRELPQNLNVQQYLIQQVEPSVNEEQKIQLSRDFADIFEFTYQLRQKCSELSQGQRQKVQLAAELINNPNILLMDEPFAHLDPMTRQDILSSLFTYVRNKEMTVLWVTHDLNEAMRFSDRMTVMQHGKLEQVGVPKDFLIPKNIYVAQFLGHKNLVAVKKIDEQWLTPWGPLNQKFDGLDAVLVIPPFAWLALGEERIEILSKNPHGFGWEIAFRSLNHNWVGQFPTEISVQFLKPDLSQCFLIQL